MTATQPVVLPARRTTPLAFRWILALVALLIYSALLREATLTGTPPPGQDTAPVNLVPFATIRATIASPLSITGTAYVLLGNFLMLGPVAIFLLAVRRRPSVGVCLLVLAAISLAIEAFQWYSNIGRVVDVDDLMLNTMGGVAVYLLTARFLPQLVGWLRTPGPRSA